MARRYVQELKDGDVVEEVYLVAEKQLRANRNAALYLSVDLRDKTGVINARMWNVTEQSAAPVQTGGFVKVRGKVQLFQGVLQMIASHVEPISATGIEMQEFEPQPLHDIEELRCRLAASLGEIQDANLKTLMECFLDDAPLMEILSQAPAGVKAHHAYHGGLLEHIVTLMDVARKICEVYAELNRDLLLCGVFLHDLGKIRELNGESGLQYTDEGQLIGHLVIGVEMLTEKIREVVARRGEPFPSELEWRLKHMILSHHGTYDFGSPKLPMTPEAVALHLIDNLDAKIFEFTRAIQDDPNSTSHWTLFIPRLDRKLFKGAR
ncbi:MAG: HD domain-containing protein [Planctomycetaceae bacterium]